MKSLPLTTLVDFIWVKEEIFFEGDTIIQDPIKTTYFYWLKYNHPDLYNIYETIQGLLVSDIMPIKFCLNNKYKLLAQSTEEMFRQELGQTHLGLLYFKHQKYANYNNYLTLPHSQLPSFNTTDLNTHLISEECLLDLYLMLNDIDKAKAHLKTKYVREHGHEPKVLSHLFNRVDEQVLTLQDELQVKQQLANNKIKEIEPIFEQQQQALLSVDETETETEIEAVVSIEPKNEAQNVNVNDRNQYIAVDNGNNLPPPPPPSGGIRWWVVSPIVVIGIAVVVKGIGWFFYEARSPQNRYDIKLTKLGHLRQKDK